MESIDRAVEERRGTRKAKPTIHANWVDCIHRRCREKPAAERTKEGVMERVSGSLEDKKLGANSERKGDDESHETGTIGPGVRWHPKPKRRHTAGRDEGGHRNA